MQYFQPITIYIFYPGKPVDVTGNKDSLEKFAGDLDKLFPERLTSRGQRLTNQHQGFGNSGGTTPTEADFDATKSNIENIERKESMTGQEDLTDTAQLLGETVKGNARYQIVFSGI